MYPAGATPDGILDMAGNVWEWCQDEFALYGKSGGSIGPRDRKREIVRVVRGGSWFYVSRGARAAYRGFFQPEDRNFDFIGFRVVGVA